jgi:hypothetical protein
LPGHPLNGIDFLRGAAGCQPSAGKHSIFWGQHCIRHGPGNSSWTPEGAVVLTPKYGLQAVKALQQLQCLGLSSCPEEHIAALLALVAAPSRLTSLHLNNVQMKDRALSAILRVRACAFPSAYCTSLYTTCAGQHASSAACRRLRVWHLLQGAHKLQHLDLRGTGVSAGPLRDLTSLRSLGLDASALTQSPGHMDLLVALCGLTHLQVRPVLGR